MWWWLNSSIRCWQWMGQTLSVLICTIFNEPDADLSSIQCVPKTANESYIPFLSLWKLHCGAQALKIDAKRDRQKIFLVGSLAVQKLEDEVIFSHLSLSWGNLSTLCIFDDNENERLRLSSRATDVFFIFLNVWIVYQRKIWFWEVSPKPEPTSSLHLPVFCYPFHFWYVSAYVPICFTIALCFCFNAGVWHFAQGSELSIWKYSTVGLWSLNGQEWIHRVQLHMLFDVERRLAVSELSWIIWEV